MKTLYLIGGTMGVGKTTVSQKLKEKAKNAVFLDGDWCWDADPFVVTEETKTMVMRNICYLLNGFLHCSAYENIVFCWVMHEQSIIDEILAHIDTADCAVRVFSLTASPATLTVRIHMDIHEGRRSIDALGRSLARLPLYEAIDSIKIATDGKDADTIAEEILQTAKRQ